MQARLVARETGDVSPEDFAQFVTSGLLRAFAPAPQHRFHGDAPQISSPAATDQTSDRIRAQAVGVSSLALDKFDGRILLSGGAEGSIKIWDLEECSNPATSHAFKPLSTIPRRVGDQTAGGHSHGVTHLAFYPFDPDAFLSSSYDKSLKLWATQKSALSAQFDLGATIYSHSSSPIADHLLVACATQHSNVRLVDLRSGAYVQALVAHGGPVLCTAWSPRHQHILVSGHADGGIRVWDIRRAGGVIAQFDQEDTLGVVKRYQDVIAAGADWERAARSRASAKAHDEAVNGLQWTDDGRYIVSAGLDRRIRVWDAATGANTLTGFGPLVQNQDAKTATMVLSPSALSKHGELIFWPNSQEILVFELRNGNLLSRLRERSSRVPKPGQMAKDRINCIVWRGAGGGGRQIGPVMGGGTSLGAVYSAHRDGQIRAWMPQVPGPDDLEDDVLAEDEETKKRKRNAVEDAYRSLMGKQITFT